MDEKFAKFKREFLLRFKESSNLRNFLNVVNVDQNSKRTDFFKVGVNNLIDTEIFLDFNNDPIFSHHYATDIARGEDSLIIRSILEKVNKKENNLVAEKNLSEKDILSGISKLRKDGLSPDLIITHPANADEFWYMKLFNSEKTRNGFSWGTYESCNVVLSFGMPKDVTLILDSGEIGNILIKRDIKGLEDIEMFEKISREEIINPEIKDIDLTKKSRVLIFEILGFELRNPDAVAILRQVADSDKKSLLD